MLYSFSFVSNLKYTWLHDHICQNVVMPNFVMVLEFLLFPTFTLHGVVGRGFLRPPSPPPPDHVRLGFSVCWSSCSICNVVWVLHLSVPPSSVGCPVGSHSLLIAALLQIQAGPQVPSVLFPGLHWWMAGCLWVTGIWVPASPELPSQPRFSLSYRGNPEPFSLYSPYWVLCSSFTSHSKTSRSLSFSMQRLIILLWDRWS